MNLPLGYIKTVAYCHERTTPDKSPTEFGARLKAERLRMNYSLAQFARLSGVAVSSITAYENRGATPTLTIAAKFAQALDCTLDWLAGLED